MPPTQRRSCVAPGINAFSPGTVIGTEKDTESDFLTTKRGGRYATSIGGTLTGRGGNIILIDDPLKPGDAMSSGREAVNVWFDQTASSRLNNKAEGAIVIVMQRLHIDDLVGHVFQRQEGWRILTIPAIAESAMSYPVTPGWYYDRPIGEPLHAAREPLEILERLKVQIGSYDFSAQYQQRPIPLEGEIVKWRWFKTYQELPPGYGRIVQSWDPAQSDSDKSDYSVCTTWKVFGQDYYLVDIVRKRLIFPELKREVVENAKLWRAADIVIEDKGSGTALLQQLGYENNAPAPRPVAFVPKQDKVTRLHAQSAVIEQGRVHLPERAPWLDALQSEIAQFPHGRHDDQVDSMSQFLNWITERERNQITFSTFTI